MSSILSNTNVSSSSFNAFHSFGGFAILDVEIPKTFSEENFGTQAKWNPENHENMKEQLVPIKARQTLNSEHADNKPEDFVQDSNQGPFSTIFGKSKSIIEFFYTEEKEVIEVDSSNVYFDDYEIF